jgi:hypothetical protein
MGGFYLLHFIMRAIYSITLLTVTYAKLLAAKSQLASAQYATK